MITDLELQFAKHLSNEEAARQKSVLKARRYYEGDQDTFLNDRLKAFLNIGDGDKFNLNVCRLVVGSVEERLVFLGMNTDEPSEEQSATGEDHQPVARPVAEWAEQIYGRNQLGILSSDVHELALSEGEAFIIVDWDDEHGYARFIPHPAYVSPDVGGDGFGCKAHYPDGDTSQPLLYISKRWTERVDAKRTRRRLTLYYPDRVEKYELVDEALKQFRDEGDQSWPIPTVGGRCNAIHFKNTSTLRPEHTDAIPVQNGVNKTVIDLLGSADSTAFQIFVALGWIPTTDGKPPREDGSNIATVEPALVLGTTKSKQDTDFKAIDGSDLTPLLNLLSTLLSGVAVVSSTPESRLSFTRQIAAEGTLKEQNEGLFAKVRKRQKMYDPAWVEVFEVARLLQNEYGDKIPDEPEFIATWEPIQARDTQDERDEWRVKREMGIPQDQIWREMGYSEAQIAKMQGSPEYQARVAMLGVDMTMNDSEDG